MLNSCEIWTNAVFYKESRQNRARLQSKENDALETI